MAARLLRPRDERVPRRWLAGADPPAHPPASRRPRARRARRRRSEHLGDRRARRVLERLGESGVGSLRGERLVPRAGDGIVDPVDDLRVGMPPGRRRRLLVQHRGEQRVREPDRAVVELDHPVRERRFQRWPRQAGRPAACHGRRRAAGRRASPAAGRAGVRPRDASRLSRHRQRLRRIDVRSERAGELERVERVPAGGLVETEERGPGEDPPEPELERPVQRTGAERSDEEALETVVDRLLEAGRRRTDPDATGEQQADPCLGQPPQSEGERVRRRRVQPLDVVDRDEHGPALGERLERTADGDGDASGSRRARPPGRARAGRPRAPAGAARAAPSAPRRTPPRAGLRARRSARPRSELSRSRGEHAEATSASSVDARRARASTCRSPPRLPARAPWSCPRCGPSKKACSARSSSSLPSTLHRQLLLPPSCHGGSQRARARAARASRRRAATSGAP